MKVHEAREQELPATAPARIRRGRAILKEQETAICGASRAKGPGTGTEQDVPVHDARNLRRIRCAARAPQLPRRHAEDRAAWGLVRNDAVVGRARPNARRGTGGGFTGIATHRHCAGAGTEIERRPVRAVSDGCTHAHGGVRPRVQSGGAHVIQAGIKDRRDVLWRRADVYPSDTAVRLGSTDDLIPRIRRIRTLRIATVLSLIYIKAAVVLSLGRLKKLTCVMVHASLPSRVIKGRAYQATVSARGYGVRAGGVVTARKLHAA